MLGKLLKHEWCTSWKVPTLFIGVMLIMSALAGVAFNFLVWDSDNVGLIFSVIMMILMYYLIIIVASYGVTVYMAVRYYKSMFTDEGYLTHTLPATGRQLLLSKVINTSAWILISTIAIIISVAVFVGIILLILAGMGEFTWADWIEMWADMKKMSEFYGWQGFLGSSALMMIVSPFSGAMMIIGSVNLGQMLRKHRILGAIGSYFLINMVVGIITWIVTLPINIHMLRVNSRAIQTSMFSTYTPTYLITTVISLVVAVGLYFLSEYLVTKKLDLE